MSSVDSDNLYPNNGEYFSLRAPRDQLVEAKQEEREAYSHVKLIKEMVGRLEGRVAFYASVDSVPDETLTNPEEFMHVIAANKLTRENLKRELEGLEVLIKEHIK